MKTHSDAGLVERFSELIAEHGRKRGANQEIAVALNAEGLTTARGKQWTATEVGRWVVRHPELLEVEEQTGTKAEPLQEATTIGAVTTSQEDTKPEGMPDYQAVTETVVPRRDATEAELNTEALAALAALYRSGKLQEVVTWYETTNGKISVIDTLERRPLFKGSRGADAKNTGVKISGLILSKAVEKLKTEPQRVGSSLSKLVEFLLWQYIGSPTELVEGIDMDPKDKDAS